MQSSLYFINSYEIIVDESLLVCIALISGKSVEYCFGLLVYFEPRARLAINQSLC